MYTIGILIFARGMISGGLHGMPRRTFMAQATYYDPAWRLPGILTGVGGTLTPCRRIYLASIGVSSTRSIAAFGCSPRYSTHSFLSAR